MLGRRSFLISCGSLVAGLAPARRARADTQPAALPQPRREANETRALELHILGWDTPFDSEPGARGQVWIGINRSWRAAWR